MSDDGPPKWGLRHQSSSRMSAVVLSFTHNGTLGQQSTVNAGRADSPFPPAPSYQAIYCGLQPAFRVFLHYVPGPLVHAFPCLST